MDETSTRWKFVTLLLGAIAIAVVGTPGSQCGTSLLHRISELEPAQAISRVASELNERSR